MDSFMNFRPVAGAANRTAVDRINTAMLPALIAGRRQEAFRAKSITLLSEGIPRILGPLSDRVGDRFNIAELLLEDHQPDRADNVAIRFEEGELTYEGLLERVNRFGNALRETAGLGIGDPVMLLLPDSPEFVISFLGSVKIGAVPVLTNPQLNASDYRQMFNLSRATAAVVSDQAIESVRSVMPELKYLEHVIMAGDSGLADGQSFQETIRSGSPELAAAETMRDDPAFWLWTSGTTGSPQAVVHLQHDILFTADAYANHILKLRESDICFSASKLFFAYGLGNSLSFPLRYGASSVLFPGRPSPERLLELIDKYRPTVFFAVPTIYNALCKLDNDLTKEFDLGSIRLCASAGEALPAKVWSEWKRKFGIEILDGIGTTEVLHDFISNQEGKVRPGSCGLPVPGYEVKLVDEWGDEVTSPRQNGFLMVKGDSTTPFYWLNHERTKKTIVGEWIYTGDIFYRDEDGFYWHQGRSTDMLKPRGLWVSPIEVEGALLGHEAVYECAVVGVRDEMDLEKVVAFVVPKEGYAGGPELVSDIKRFLRDRIDPYKIPTVVEFVSELPKTSTGKIRRFLLRERETATFTKVRPTVDRSPRMEPGNKRGTTHTDEVPRLVNLEYIRLREVCRYQNSGTCTMDVAHPHECTPSMCQLLR